MPILVVKRYTREEIRQNPDKLYVFGDNCHRKGNGGQAKETRGEPNTVGIRTKLAPTYHFEDYMKDDHYIDNVSMIFEDFGRVFDALKRGETVVWPLDGIGTGLARLPQNATRTLAFIENLMEDLAAIYGKIDNSGDIVYSTDNLRMEIK